MGPAEQRLSLGGEARREDFDPEGERDRSRNSVGVFAQDELGLFERRLLIVPGLRFEATEDFAPALDRALAAGRCAVIELRIDPQSITTRTTLDAIREKALVKHRG